MENKFYVGTIIHKNIFNKVKYEEKIILYSRDQILFVDLNNQIEYSLNERKRDYVDLNSLINIDINDLKIDYIYLLRKYKENNRNFNRKIIKILQKWAYVLL